MYGLQIKESKCQFGLSEIELLGYVVSAEGIKPQVAKVGWKPEELGHYRKGDLHCGLHPQEVTTILVGSKIRDLHSFVDTKKACSSNKGKSRVETV